MRSFVIPRLLGPVTIVAAWLTAADVSYAAPPRPPDPGAVLRDQGNAAARAERLRDAIEAWRNAWVHDRNDPDLACNIGRFEFRLANYPEAATWLTRCVRLHPNATTPESVVHLVNCTNELQSSRAKVAALVIKAEAGTQVVIGKDIVRFAPFTEDVFVLPGEYHINASIGPRFTSLDVIAEAGKEHPVSIELPPAAFIPIYVPPAPPTPPPAPPTPPPAPAAVFGAPPGLSLPPSLMVHVIGKDGLLPYFAHDPNAPSEPSPGPFRWWPIVIGSTITGAALVSAAMCAALSGEVTEEKGKKYQLAKDLSLVGATAFGLATLGFALYEDRRTSVTLYTGGIKGTHKW